MTITIETIPARARVTAQCDAPGCSTHLESVTDTGLAAILRGFGWYIGPETPPLCGCPSHARAMAIAAGPPPVTTTADRATILATLLNDCGTVQSGMALLAWGVAAAVENCDEEDRDILIGALVATVGVHLARLDAMQAADVPPPLGQRH